MPCTHVKVGGFAAIVCTRGRRPKRCGWCSAPHSLLCDWKVGGGKTCDKPICAAHAFQVGIEKHLCPDHKKTYVAWRAAREVSTA